jgi:hypothetical protein
MSSIVSEIKQEGEQAQFLHYTHFKKMANKTVHAVSPTMNNARTC